MGAFDFRHIEFEDMVSLEIKRGCAEVHLEYRTQAYG
jgi:hypothetical protein